jgi:hypothetical protein
MKAASTFSKTQTLFNSGAIEDARALAKTRDTRPLRDPAVHGSWANLLEEMGSSVPAFDDPMPGDPGHCGKNPA